MDKGQAPAAPLQYRRLSFNVLLCARPTLGQLGGREAGKCWCESEPCNLQVAADRHQNVTPDGFRPECS